MVKQASQSHRRFLKRLQVAAIAALYFGSALWAGARADDTEIYINKLPSAQTPNVLFTIDTSGSMDTTVPDGSQSRMEAVKDALTGLINDTSNLKAGLGRFHEELGGPIIFPVTNLDGAPDFLNETQSVSSIDRSSDDAEEVNDVVTLDDPALELTQLNAGGDTSITTFERDSADSNDDDEDGGSGSYALDSVDLDVGQEDAGVRFSNVDIPRNAVILHAEIEFTAAGSEDDNTDVRILGHDVDNSPPFEESGDNDIDDRENEVTDASVVWSNIVPVETGDVVTTPNLRTIVKDIVDRPGWSTGNDMSFLIEDERGHREFATVDNDDWPGAKLRVQYVTSATEAQYRVSDDDYDAIEDSSGDLQEDYNGIYLMEDDDYGVDANSAGVIFEDVDIPADAAVLWADVTWYTRNERTSAASNLEIYGIQESDPGPFTDGNSISDRTPTSGRVVWDGTYSEGDEEIFAPEDQSTAPNGGGVMSTPNLATLIQEVRTNTSYQSGDNLGFVIQDESGGWVTDRHMCSYDGVEQGNECPEELSARPTLRLVYAFPPDTTPEHQDVGLRFNNVQVPQGATIESARLELTVGGAGAEPGALTIAIEDSTEPATYNNTDAKISDRSYTGSTTWNTDAWNTIGEIKRSPDLSSLVSSVTDDANWCGGGSLAFRITSSDAAVIAQSFDTGGSGVPTLRISYDTDSLTSGEGCTTRQTSVSIEDEDNDVEEHSDGDIDFDSNSLDIESGRWVGLRFEGVQVPLGATITDANLFLTGDDFDSGDTSFEVQAQQHPNAPAFSDADDNVSDRVDSSGPAVTWPIDEDWEEDGIYSTQADGADLTSLITEIIDGTVTDSDGNQWSSGNAMVFTLAGENNNDRNAEVCCGSDPSARLEISYRVNLGDAPEVGKVTGRQAMLGIIDDLIASGFTPPVDAMYEGATYFEGNDVHYGRTRGAGMSYEGPNETTDGDLDSQIDGDSDNELLWQGELSRLSHPATYDPQSANVVRPGDCTGDNPNDDDCAHEHIDNNATPTYVSPFDGSESCERGFLVLLSDGIANRNSSRDLIRGLTGASSCDLDIPEIDDSGAALMDGNDFETRNPSSDEMCGLELADYLHDKDFIDEENDATDVRNNVRTFTIGFDLTNTFNRSAVEFLKALAFVGSGGNLDDPDGVEDVSYGDGFYTANSAEQLQDVFEVIIEEITKETTSFVAPGISTNAFNRLFNLDDIYFSLFEPADSVAWQGNMKKFKLCTDQDSCEFGETIDRNLAPAVNDEEDADGNPLDVDTFGTLKETAQGFWSEADDSAPVISEGGAGERIPTYTERNVYINTDSGAVPSPDDGDSVSAKGTAPHAVDLTNDTDSAPSSGDPADFNDLKTALRDRGNCDSGTIDEQNACLNDLIEWMTGKKFDGDEPRDGSDDDDDRWAFGDPMHSRPLVLTYGKNDGGTSDNPDDDRPLSKIFVGTNDGGVRMINEADGVEEWIFFPNSMLGMQSELKDDPRGAHEYGIDDTPTARLKNTDGDGVIEPGDGDFVHLYFGLRRGGRQLFALNVTPDSTIGLDSSADAEPNSAEKDKITPEVLWRIDGSQAEFERLGMTWSTPRPVQIKGADGEPRTVLIFGGGYDPSQDGSDNDGTTPDGGDSYNSSTSGDAQGNAIFMVDADTGERLWWASGSTDGNGDSADADVGAMNTAIAAPVTTLDSDGDGLVDRIYAVDLRGQVFRVDIETSSTQGDFSPSSAGVLARLGPDESSIPAGEQAPNTERRKFFYAPEVSRVTDTTVVEDSYELISLVSGNRSEPQGKTVLDRAYTIRDFLTQNPAGGLTGSNYPECNAAATSCSAGTPLTNASLTNVTEQDNFVVRDDSQGAITLTDSSGTELSDGDASLTSLRQSHGWYFDLEGANFDLADPDLTGEKGFSTATVLDGKMFFTTFLPPDQSAESDTACSVPAALGSSRFYAVDVFTGAPAFDRNADSSFEEAERFKNVGAGPSADIIPAYLPGGVTLPVPTGAGAVSEDPDVDQYTKTFWLEER